LVLLKADDDCTKLLLVSAASAQAYDLLLQLLLQLLLPMLLPWQSQSRHSRLGAATHTEQQQERLLGGQT
jgi:hypothetical protein